MEDAVRFKKQLLAKEYGSNILNLVEYVVSIEDRTKRTEQAILLKKLIEKMNPTLKFAENADQKIWGDMYVLGNMELDVDVEFEKPSTESLLNKPENVPYNRYKPKFKHYGKNIELIMDKIIAETNEEVRKEAIIGMGKLMKTFYRNWNKESIEDDLIAKQIRQLSDGKVVVPAELLENPTLFDSKRTGNANNGHGPVSASNSNFNGNSNGNTNGNTNRNNNNRNNNNNNRNRNRNNKKK